MHNGIKVTEMVLVPSIVLKSYAVTILFYHLSQPHLCSWYPAGRSETPEKPSRAKGFRQLQAQLDIDRYRQTQPDTDRRSISESDSKVATVWGMTNTSA